MNLQEIIIEHLRRPNPFLTAEPVPRLVVFCAGVIVGLTIMGVIACLVIS